MFAKGSLFIAPMEHISSAPKPICYSVGIDNVMYLLDEMKQTSEQNNKTKSVRKRNEQTAIVECRIRNMEAVIAAVVYGVYIVDIQWKCIAIRHLRWCVYASGEKRLLKSIFA